jgi:hypothetical protein
LGAMDRHESGAKAETALAVRTERFQELHCNYPTYGRAHKGGGIYIDHVFTSLPPEAQVAGGSPSSPVWESVSDQPSRVRELLHPGD